MYMHNSVIVQDYLPKTKKDIAIRVQHLVLKL